MAESDEVIYKRFVTGHNEDDFRILLERHRESLTLFIMGYVNNIDDAEELMLDAFAEVAAARGFLGKSSFKTWLFSIGKNLALMRIRKKRIIFSTLDESIAENVISETDTPDLEILKEERNRQLFRALEQINSDYRQILILLYFEEMSVEEAGRVMGKSRKNIYNLAERGRHALKVELERMGFDNAKYE